MQIQHHSLHPVTGPPLHPNRKPRRHLELSWATDPQQREEVYRLRYEICREDHRTPPGEVDHVRKTVTEGLDSFGHLLVAKEGDRIVGTVRINLSGEGCFGRYRERYGLEELAGDGTQGISITTALMIRLEYRSGTLAGRLAMQSYRFGLEKGVITDAIGCQRPLVSFFERLGYRHPVERLRAEHPDDLVLLRLELHDQAHLDSVRSPFAALLRKGTPGGAIEREQTPA